jgi:hypothetical protein
MTEAALPYLKDWSNFYVMVGSAAAALTGLMFVVITLVTRRERMEGLHDGIAVFSTPTIVHFAGALFISAVFSAPWHSSTPAVVLLGLFGLYGLGRIVQARFRVRHFASYDPDFEDWVWYTVFPFLIYALISAGAFTLPSIPVVALFAIAAGAVALIFIGIRNAWDVVTFLAIEVAERSPRD